MLNFLEEFAMLILFYSNYCQIYVCSYWRKQMQEDILWVLSMDFSCFFLKRKLFMLFVVDWNASLDHMAQTGKAWCGVDGQVTYEFHYNFLDAWFTVQLMVMFVARLDMMEKPGEASMKEIPFDSLLQHFLDVQGKQQAQRLQYNSSPLQNWYQRTGT